jgi:hypothetical protein
MKSSVVSGSMLVARSVISVFALLLFARSAAAQIQVQLKFNRLQYIAYEPLLASVTITNRAGRDIDLRDADGQQWFGFEVTGREGQSIGPAQSAGSEPLHIEASKSVTRKINLTPLFPMQDFGSYHVRAHVYFADLGKYFYSPTKVVEVSDARPIWRQSVGVPDASPVTDDTRTYSLMTNRFSDHTSLYVRVEDEKRGIVYAVYSLGRVIAFDEPHAEIDRKNQLQVLHCSAPRTWSYSVIGLNGDLISHSTLLEAKSRPHFKRSPDGEVAVVGGMKPPDASLPPTANVPKLSTRPAPTPAND